MQNGRPYASRLFVLYYYFLSCRCRYQEHKKVELIIAAPNENNRIFGFVSHLSFDELGFHWLTSPNCSTAKAGWNPVSCVIALREYNSINHDEKHKIGFRNEIATDHNSNWNPIPNKTMIKTKMKCINGVNKYHHQDKAKWSNINKIVNQWRVEFSTLNPSYSTQLWFFLKMRYMYEETKYVCIHRLKHTFKHLKQFKYVHLFDIRLRDSIFFKQIS